MFLLRFAFFRREAGNLLVEEHDQQQEQEQRVTNKQSNMSNNNLKCRPFGCNKLYCLNIYLPFSHFILSEQSAHRHIGEQ